MRGQGFGDVMDLDTAYANAPFIEGAEHYPPRWRAAAAAFRDALGPRARCDIPYGPSARQKLDLFLPEGTARGLMVFVHGGFWRAFGRSDWSHFASGALARGWAVAMPGYTLAPEVRLYEIRREVTRAVEVAAEAVAGPVVLTGHSAGGHLVARLLCEDVALASVGRLARVVPISPLADLRVFLRTRMNADFRLDAAEAAAESPMLHRPRAGADAHVWVGGAERPAFLDQARWLARAWRAPLTVAPERHHFDVIDALCADDSPLVDTLLQGL